MNSEQNATDGSIRVMKRDGSIEPFVFAKLHNCLCNAFLETGESHDRKGATAKALAEAVYDYLRKVKPLSAVPSEELAKLVELVLTQTGHAAAGLAIRQRAQARDHHRRWLRVASRRERDGRYVQRQWSKGRVFQYLRREHRLDSPASRIIASRVEQLVMECGLKVVTTGLVEEMTKSELLAWGLLPGALVVKRRGTQRDADALKDMTEQS